MATQRDVELPLLNAVIEAAKVGNKAKVFEDAWNATIELLKVKDQLIQAQKDDRAKELASAASINPDLAAFTEWLKNPSEGEFSGSALEFRSLGDGKGNGVFVKPGKFVRKGDIAMKVPLSLCLYGKVEANPEDKGVEIPDYAAQHFMIKSMPAFELAVALLIEWNKGSESRFAPYLAILPRSFETVPLFWTERELELVKRETDFPVVARRIQDISMVYSQLCVQDARFRELLGTYENFAWSVCVAMTRQNPLPGIEPRRFKYALVPAFDMCNHDPDAKAITTDYMPQTKMFDCRAHKNFDEKEEFTIFYGPRTDVEFFLYSGFIPNPPGVNRNSPLILMFSLHLEETPELAKVKRVLVEKVNGIVPMAHENYFHVKIGGDIEDKALRLFARGAAAKSKEDVQVALKKKLQDPDAPLTKVEKDFVEKTLKEQMSKLPPFSQVDSSCREAVVKTANDLRLSHLAILQRILTKLLQ